MSVMCRLYGVTRAGYYAWKGRAESARAKADGRLWVHIERIYQASGGTYGSPRIHAALKAQGSGVGKKRVERSMRKHGLRARSQNSIMPIRVAMRSSLAFPTANSVSLPIVRAGCG
jgi:putative transposase